MQELKAENERLRRDCAELYQVIGTMAGHCPDPCDQGIIKALDNASAAAAGEPRRHDDLLPFILPEPVSTERLRYIIGALVEWRDKPWSPKGISVAGLTSHRETTNLDEQIEKARAETISVWDAAREAIKPADGGDVG